MTSISDLSLCGYHGPLNTQVDMPLVMARSAAVAPISQTAEYALRAMSELALVESGTALNASELSRATSVPVHYLSKVLRRLVAAGLLISQKGHGGGFVLARPAHRIRFADVLEAMGEAPASGHCAFGWGDCDARHPCPLHPAWSSLNDALVRWANDSTLANLRRQRRR